MRTFNIIAVIFLILTFFIVVPVSGEDPPKKKIKKKQDTIRVDTMALKINNEILREQRIARDSLSVELDSILKMLKKE